MFGRSLKIKPCSLIGKHCDVANAAQDLLEQLTKGRVRWGGITVLFDHQGSCQDGETYEATARGYYEAEGGGKHNFHATFGVRIYDGKTVEIEQGPHHNVSFEYRHEYWHHYRVLREENGSMLTKFTTALPHDPWTRADGTKVVLSEPCDF